MSSAVLAESVTDVRILCVDDEPRVLEGLENHLAMHYDVTLATSGPDGLESLRSGPPFALVISDMRMPEMNGATFLREVRKCSPHTTRMLLTGQSDIDSAIAAVNDGQIFRFLSKPCAPQRLLQAVQDGIRQNQLVLGEKALLNNTLNGSVSVLADVMALATPTAFSRVSSLKACVKHMCEKLGVLDTWQYELAASLAQLGCIALPPDTLEKLYTRQELNEKELSMLEGHPSVGERLLARIPRLEAVAAMIGNQHRPPAWTGEDCPSSTEETVVLGSNMLNVALAFDELIVSGQTPRGALRLLRERNQHPSPLLQSLKDFEAQTLAESIRALSLRELRPCMVLEEDVVSKAGNTIVSKGRELTHPLLERLRNFAKGVGVIEPIRVRVLR